MSHQTTILISNYNLVLVRRDKCSKRAKRWRWGISDHRMRCLSLFRMMITILNRSELLL